MADNGTYQEDAVIVLGAAVPLRQNFWFSANSVACRRCDMEILNIKNETASLFIMGKIVGDEEIKITCDNDCTVQKQNGSLYRFKKYNILLFNEDRSTEIVIDGNKTAPLYTLNNSGFAFYEFEFCKAGEKVINITSGGKAFASITFDVCAENFLYKQHFSEIINKINKTAEPEAYGFLKDVCVKHNIKYKDNIFLTFESFYKRFISELKRCCAAEKRSKRNLLLFRRKWNMKRKEELKKSFISLLNLTDKFLPFCDELCNLKKELEDKVFQSPIVEVETKDASKKDEKLCLLNEDCILIGDYINLAPKDIDKAYGLYCYTALVDVLTRNYTPVKKQVFKTDGGRYILNTDDFRKSSFANTLNDNIITVTCNTEENVPQITVKVSAEDKDTAYRKLYILKPFYKNEASENEISEIHRYMGRNKNSCACKVYGVCINNSANFENIIALSPYNTENLNEWVKNAAGDGETFEYLPIENFAGLFTKDEFDERNVCVAVVKTKSQFDINIKEKFYYIPARYIDDIKKIRYVALYQSKTLFKDKSGIRYYGEVERTSIVERYKISEIPSNSDELYCRFDIKGWQMLKEDIKTKDFAEICMMTSLPLLKSVKSFPELYMNSFLEYILYMADENARFAYKGALFKCDKDFVSVYLSDGQGVKFSKKSMKNGILKTEALLKESYDTSDEKEAGK